MNPTPEQLAARLNPTPATVYTPSAGLSTDTNREWLYLSGANGVQAMNIRNVLTGNQITAANQKYGNAMGAINGARDLLSSQYGIDINGLPTVNRADMDAAQMGAGHVGSNGMADYGESTINNFVSQKAATVTPTTVNNIPNTLAPGGTNSPAGAPAGQIDYTLHPGETIAAYNARIAAANPNLPAPGTTSSTGITNNAPMPTAIGNPITPPVSGGMGTPNLPKPTGASALDTFSQSLTAQLATQQEQLKASYQAQADKYQTQITDLNKQQQELQQLQDAGMASYSSVTQQETASKQAALALEQKQYQENYDASQALINEMSGLLTTGNQVIQQMKDTTGLASIMSPRIAQTMTDVAARAGVIQAVLAARNNQIGVAQNQLQSSLSAISSIANDQINYYKSVIDFYQQQKSDNAAQISSLSKDQKSYIDAQISQLEQTVANTQNTAALISKAMLDPSTALTYAKAGVSLTDSVYQINYKLAVQGYAQELSDSSNKMASAGYSSTPIAGVQPVMTTDSQGNQKAWYKEATTGGFTIGNTRFDAQGNVVATAPAKTSMPTPVTGGYKFTATQLNTGAATAVLTLDSFKGLPGEVQNFYINSKPLATAFVDALAAVKGGSSSAEQVKGNIQAMNIPAEVKTHLIQQVDAIPAKPKMNMLGDIWAGVKSLIGL